MPDSDTRAPTPTSTASDPSPGRTVRRARRIVLGLAVVAVVAIVLFMTVGVDGQWDFAIPRRARKVVGMALVGYAVGASTVVFQTVTDNRILTPSIMGFDALYVLIQTVIVFFFGSIAATALSADVLFVVEVGLMIVFAGALFRWVFGAGDRSRHGLYYLVLIGIVFGTMFNAASSLLQRLIDPNEFQTLQDRLFASVNAIDETLLGISIVVVLATSVLVLRLVRHLDVLTLGRDNAVALGVDHRQVVNRALIVVAVLVSVSTALVGPITFFGLLVANLAHELLRTYRHDLLVPAASLLGIIALVGGQLALEQVFGFDSALTVIINFVGGIYFIVLLVGRRTGVVLPEGRAG